MHMDSYPDRASTCLVTSWEIYQSSVGNICPCKICTVSVISFHAHTHLCRYIYIYIYIYIYHHHHHHLALVARISLTLSRHSSLSFIALGRSSGHIAAECMFVQVVLLLHGHVWGFIRVHLL